MARRPIETVLREHTTEWMSLPGVLGCGVGVRRGRPYVSIIVLALDEELSEKLPKTVEGYRVVVKETGEIRALDTR